MTMLELIGRRAGVSELVMSVPNSPECGKDIAAFLGAGLSGWATDDLSTVAPKTARAIEEVRVSFTCLVNCFVDSWLVGWLVVARRLVSHESAACLFGAPSRFGGCHCEDPSRNL